MIQKRTDLGEKRVERNIVMRYQGGSYRVRLTFGGIKIDETFDSLHDARAYRDRMRADSVTDPTHRMVLESKQKKADIGKITFSALLDRYLTEVTPTKRGAYVESTKIGKLKRYDVAKLPLNLMKRDAIQNFIETTKREKWSENNTRKYLMLISGVFQVAIKRWGMPLDNPVRSCEIPGNGKARERRLEPEEFDYLLAALEKSKNPYAARVFEMAVHTAARRGELLKLLRKDVNFSNATAVFRETKNSDDRTIPLSKRALEICRNVPDIPKEPRLFPITEVQLRHAFDRAKKHAKDEYDENCLAKKIKPNIGFLDDLRFHDLRHEAVSRLSEKGVYSVMEIALISGHKTLSMLQRYTNLRATDLTSRLG
jgi:integrase